MEVETVIVVKGYTLEEAICKELGFYLMANQMPMKSTGKLQPDLHFFKGGNDNNWEKNRTLGWAQDYGRVDRIFKITV